MKLGLSLPLYNEADVVTEVVASIHAAQSRYREHPGAGQQRQLG